MFASTSRGAAA